MLLSPLSSLSRALKIGVTSKTLSQMEMTTVALWTIRPRLMAVPGVANVAVWGQRDRQLQVLVDPDRLHANAVTLADVIAAARERRVRRDRRLHRHAEPALRDRTSQRRHDRARPGADRRAARRGRAASASATWPTVTEGFPPPIGDAIINNVPGLLLIVEKQLGANTLAVTRGVEEALESLEPALVGIDVDPTIFRPATFIEMSLANLNRALIIGCVLVVLVLIAFLADWRTALISSVAIPLSLLGAAWFCATRAARSTRWCSPAS